MTTPREAMRTVQAKVPPAWFDVLTNLADEKFEGSVSRLIRNMIKDNLLTNQEKKLGKVI